MVSLDCGVLHGGGRGGVRLVQELNHPLHRQRQRPQHAHAAGTACVMETVLLVYNFLMYTSYLSYCSLFTAFSET